MVMERPDVLMALIRLDAGKRHRPGGCNGGAQRAPLPNKRSEVRQGGAVLQHTSCITQLCPNPRKDGLPDRFTDDPQSDQVMSVRRVVRIVTSLAFQGRRKLDRAAHGLCQETWPCAHRRESSAA